MKEGKAVGIRQHKESVGVRRIEDYAAITAAERVAAVAARLRAADPTMSPGQAARRANAVLDPDPQRRDATQHADAKRVENDARLIRTMAGAQRHTDRNPKISPEDAARAAALSLRREADLDGGPTMVLLDGEWRPAGRTMREAADRVIEEAARAAERREIDFLARHDRAKARTQEQDHGH